MSRQKSKHRCDYLEKSRQDQTDSHCIRRANWTFHTDDRQWNICNWHVGPLLRRLGIIQVTIHALEEKGGTDE